MIIYEDTNILVGGAFLKCFSILLLYNPLSFSVSIIIFLIRHFLVILTLSDYSGTLCTTLDQPFTCGGGQGVLDPRSPPPLTLLPAPSTPASRPYYSLPAPSTPASRPLLPRFPPPLPPLPAPSTPVPYPAPLPPLPAPFTSYPVPPVHPPYSY